MKKALKLMLVWIAWLAAGIVIGTFFYSLYLHSLGLVAGKESFALSKHNIILSFFIVAEAMVFLNGLFLIAYKIRHAGGGLQLTAFIITQVVSWGILLPGNWKLEQNYKLKHKAELLELKNNTTLSKGFFREADDTVYYFLDDLKTSYSPEERGTVAVVIDTSETGKTKVVEIDRPGALNIVEQALPYKDILIRDTFRSPWLKKMIFISDLLEQADRSFMCGWTFALGFMTLGLALAAIYALSGFASWRIINYSISGIMYFLVLLWNCIYYSPILEEFTHKAFLHSGLFRILADYVNEPFLAVTNVAFALIVITIGIIKTIIRRKRGR